MHVLHQVDICSLHKYRIKKPGVGVSALACVLLLVFKSKVITMTDKVPLYPVEA